MYKGSRELVNNHDKHEKYDTKNPLGQFLIKNFMGAIDTLLFPIKRHIYKITECGCGQGHVTRQLSKSVPHAQVTGFDISLNDLKIAAATSSPRITFKQKSIYKLAQTEKADLVVCCEVLEHLEDPLLALEKMLSLNAKYYLFSVPREPIWKLCQFLVGNNMAEWGNTPGHINHWSGKAFDAFLGKYFQPIRKMKPFPWQMSLVKAMDG